MVNSILGLYYWDSGKENGNYYNRLYKVILGYLARASHKQARQNLSCPG